ncbi:MAG: hypothetical protein BZY81_08020 [SAR202 cluster bacterium Io17-Chloro-G4]|nr:MAG: hypothetical protein BZY81_08020 [SAR202 cluster bacterium Io17-Chloro-G4]
MAGSTVKIEGAKFILTVDQGRRIIQDGSILIEGRDITQVGKASEMAGVAADRVIDASEMVVTPGFCNGHMHISYAHATRGIFPDSLDPGDYLTNVFALQSAMTEEEEYLTSLLGITELLKYGTTCFLDPGSTKFLDTCMKAYEESGCRIVLGKQVVDQDNPLNLPVYPLNEAVSIMEDTVKSYNGMLDGRISAWTMPFASEYCNTDLLVAAKDIADRYNTSMTLHQSNARFAIDFHQQKYGKRPIKYLEDIGVLGPNVLLAHVIGVDPSEVDSMARTGTRAVMCPTAALKMGQGITSKGMLPEMLEQNICVGLGTDAGNNSSLIEAMRSMYLITVIFKDARQSTSMIPAETALEMATIQGATALGLDSQIGSIEVGKKADLVLFDTKRPEWRTMFNPVNNLVYNADGRSVHTVLVDGNVVVEDHKPTFVDEWELIQKVQELGAGMLQRTGISFPQRWPIV